MISFAVFGCGRIGHMHALNIARNPRARLVSVFDVASEAAARTANATGAAIAQSADDVFAASEIDAVLVASSTDTHLDLILAAAGAGKAIFCEKPIDLDLARVEAGWMQLRDQDPTIMIGFNRRFDPSFTALRQRIDQGVIGKVEQVAITSRDPGPPPLAYIQVSGGLFRDMTIHDFDMARYLIGDIVAVQAAGTRLVDPEIAAAGDIDGAMITLIAKSGALCQITNSRRCAYGYDQRIEVFGERGMIMAGNHRDTTLSLWDARGTAALDPLPPFFIERYGPAYNAEIDHFIDCVEQKSAPLVGYLDGLEALRLAEAALESLQTGRLVNLGAETA